MRHLSFDHYDIHIRPGSDRTLVIALAGVGDPGIAPPLEWVGAFDRLAAQCHVMFMRDLVKSWYNSPVGWLPMIRAIQRYCSRHKINRILTLGVSMGGTGAALLAAELPVKRALMLAPQAAIDDRAAFDPRFQTHWAAIAERPRPSLRGVAGATTEFLCIVTVDDLFDVLHAAEIKDALPDTRFIAVRGSHNVGGELKLRGEELAVLRWLLEDDPSPNITQFPGNIDSVIRNARRLQIGRVDSVQRMVDAAVLAKRASHVAGIFSHQLDHALFHQAAQRHPTYSQAKAHHAYPAHRGVSLSFGALQPYLGTGWSTQEFQGYWSLGDSCTFRACMADDAAGTVSIPIYISGILFVPPHQSRSFSVLQDGRLLDSITLENTMNEPLNMPFSVAFEAHGPLVALTFETPEPTVPSQVSASPDHRPLGVWLRHVKFLYRPMLVAARPSPAPTQAPVTTAASAA